MDEFDISEYLGGGFDTGGFNFDTSGIEGLDLSQFTGGGFDTGGFDFDLGNIMAELEGIGTDLGPSSSMGMDNSLLESIGLKDLIDYNGLDLSGGGVDSLQKAIDANYARDFVANGGDEMDFGGSYAENMTRGQDGDSMDFGGTPAENIGKLQGQTTGAANYTTDSKGNVYKNGSLYRAAEVADDPNDPNNPYTRISTGNIDGPIKATPTTPPVKPPPVTPPKVTTPDGTKKGMDPSMMMMLMLLLSQMGKGKGGTASQAVIPQLTANRSQLPYSAPSRPGAGGKAYFSPNTYTPSMAAGGEIVMADGGLPQLRSNRMQTKYVAPSRPGMGARAYFTPNTYTAMAEGGISTLGGYSDGGRLLKGPGDGVSDNIPATIAGKQPARLADGEFVVPARIVSELGNGSTEAGADRLYEMMDRVQKARRKTKNVAADTKARKYLPA